MSVRTAIRESSLSWFFGLILLLTLVGQAYTGLAEYNSSVTIDDLPVLSIGEYVTSSQFAVDVAENWQSEYLQFLLYIVLTVWLVQRGSPESKPVDETGGEDDKKQQVGRHASAQSPRWARAGGWRTTLYSNSLGILMGLFFLGSWGAQLVAGTSAYNSERLQNLLAPLSMPEYALSANFWNRTLQNWQSEFLAVGSMVVFSIYLRQRGSPESKPVGAPHAETGSEG
ncbi:MAG TPA: DUF6766 family protein [Lapillicoccus sp.]|jgi:hypothetical protein|nr:DUF6766 family protein [Lapillicoccus sp.]